MVIQCATKLVILLEVSKKFVESVRTTLWVNTANSALLDILEILAMAIIANVCIFRLFFNFELFSTSQ